MNAEDIFAKDERKEKKKNELLVRWLTDWINADFLAFSFVPFKSNHAVYLGKKSIVRTNPDIDTGFKTGASLTDNDRSARDNLAAVNFHSQALGIAITTVS
jgi:hypothetical protein